jgi:hypothetical protein
LRFLAILAATGRRGVACKKKIALTREQIDLSIARVNFLPPTFLACPNEATFTFLDNRVFGGKISSSRVYYTDNRLVRFCDV